MSKPRPPKSLKATTEIKEDPELWRDIQANVRKMDDLYDATFYTWLRSEDNVLVTASYLQRLAGEYELERIEHALCWLVNGWRLESIAVLVKQVTFDWVSAKGDQGEINRAKLVLALTDNWAIQYVARLACALLTSASVPPPPPTIVFSPCHSRVSSYPGSPLASCSIAGTVSATASITSNTNPAADMSVSDRFSFGTTATTFSGHSTPPSPRSLTALSSPSSPSPSYSSPGMGAQSTSTHGRRMAVSRRLGSPMVANLSGESREPLMPQSRPLSASGSSSPVLSYSGSVGRMGGHHRQSSSNASMSSRLHQESHVAYDHLRTSSSAMPLYPSLPSQQQPLSQPQTAAPSHQTAASYHPHHCTTPHHHHQHHPHSQQQHRTPNQGSSPLHRNGHLGSHSHSHSHSYTHTRQQSQPGTATGSKQYWLQQQSSFATSPIFYMNKTLFMEELSRKWSFCRLSEFFQCLDPSSGISHRFKCTLLKESALKEEATLKSKQQTSVKEGLAHSQSDQMTSTIRQPQNHGVSSQASESSLASILSRQADSAVPESAMDICSAEDDIATEATMLTPNTEQGSADPINASTATLSSLSSSSRASSGGRSRVGIVSDTQSISGSHSCETDNGSYGDSEDCVGSAKGECVSAPISMSNSTSSSSQHSQALYFDQRSYHPLQLHPQADYNDDMNSGLNRGCKSSDGSHHQHCRAQTVDAILSGPMHNSSASSSSSPPSSSTTTASSSSSLVTSASSASASMSTLSLAESHMEMSTDSQLGQLTSAQRHPQQQQQQQSYFSGFGSPGLLYRNATTLSLPSELNSTVATCPMSSPSSGMIATASSTSTGLSAGLLNNIHGQQQRLHSSHLHTLHGHHHQDTNCNKRKNSLGVSLTPPSHCSTLPTSTSSPSMHSSSNGNGGSTGQDSMGAGAGTGAGSTGMVSSSSSTTTSSIFPGPRRTSTAASTTNEDLKRLRCSRQNSTSSPSKI